jgi:hypothetical protein
MPTLKEWEEWWEECDALLITSHASHSKGVGITSLLFFCLKKREIIHKHKGALQIHKDFSQGNAYLKGIEPQSIPKLQNRFLLL